MGILTVDSSPSSTVVVCSSCGARFAATDRATALRLAAHHPAAAHGARGRVTADYRDRADRIDARRG